MLEIILKTLAFAASGALLFLLGHSLGKARGYGEGYHDATMLYKLLYGKERKPGELIEYDEKAFRKFKRDPYWEIHTVGMNKEGKNNE